MSNPRFTPDQSYTSWHVGMKVVLARDEFFNRGMHLAYGNEYPEMGPVYTIRAINLVAGNVGIHLNEIVNPSFEYLNGWAELSFAAENFRPVQTRKTDISIFTAMLSPKPSKAGKVRA